MFAVLVAGGARCDAPECGDNAVCQYPSWVLVDVCASDDAGPESCKIDFGLLEGPARASIAFTNSSSVAADLHLAMAPPSSASVAFSLAEPPDAARGVALELESEQTMQLVVEAVPLAEGPCMSAVVVQSDAANLREGGLSITLTAIGTSPP